MDFHELREQSRKSCRFLAFGTLYNFSDRPQSQSLKPQSISETNCRVCMSHTKALKNRAGFSLNSRWNITAQKFAWKMMLSQSFPRFSHLFFPSFSTPDMSITRKAGPKTKIRGTGDRTKALGFFNSGPPAAQHSFEALAITRMAADRQNGSSDRLATRTGVTPYRILVATAKLNSICCNLCCLGKTGFKKWATEVFSEVSF